jgi:regulator of protease activity HflC (stomatin/prohibitin superfamily)
MYLKYKINEYEIGLVFKDDEFKRVLRKGKHWAFRERVDIESLRYPRFHSEDLDVIYKKKDLIPELTFVDLKDNQRAILWIEGRINGVLGPGLYAYWNVLHDIKLEVYDIYDVVFKSEQLADVIKVDMDSYLGNFVVEQGTRSLMYRDGVLQDIFSPGRYAYWKSGAKINVRVVDLKESVLDISGQDIMTADKVSLRLNAVLSYQVISIQKAVEHTADYEAALYRDAQLALRTVIGGHELDALLQAKEDVSFEFKTLLEANVQKLGVQINSLGIRDIILPGEMKEILNRVTEAKKSAEAALITRREETAGMRSQANTAKILEDNATLMRLRELEVLEKVAENANLTLVMGEKGLSSNISHLL